MWRNAVWDSESLTRWAGPAATPSKGHMDQNDPDSLASALETLGLNPIDHYNPDSLVPAFQGLDLRPTIPSTPNPFPELEEYAALVLSEILNHIDYCIFIAEVSLSIIPLSLYERGVSISLTTLMQIVVAHRFLIETVMAGHLLEESTLPTPYRVRYTAYRTLASNVEVGHTILQERWQNLKETYRGALEEIEDMH
jgi:hypothetical protein